MRRIFIDFAKARRQGCIRSSGRLAFAAPGDGKSGGSDDRHDGEAWMSDGTIPVVVEPAGIELSCREGETIMQCAHRLGYYWPTICGGNGECGACRFEILEGEQNLGGEAVEESILFRRIARTSDQGFPVRFGCRARPSGALRVRRRGVSPR
jgi:2Fe-2S ferredoxin